jgi:hypothetical protein
MRKSLRFTLAAFAVAVSSAVVYAVADDTPPNNSRMLAERVYNLNRVKIIESNTSSLRPGSVYDVITYFESLLNAPKPGFNYEFIDSGLGATEPLYPMYQKGNQGSYMQLIPAFFFDSRHIDHRSSLTTPEGCKVDSAYLLRNLDEYPKTMYQQYRDEGYTRLVIRLEHYTKLKPDAECGRHIAHAPDPNFDPMKFMWENRDAMSLADFPQKELHRFEAKVSVNWPMIEQRDYDKRPRFDLNDLKHNSLWYYPDGHAFDYGIDTPRPQKGLTSFELPRQSVVEATPALQKDYPLSALLKPEEYGKVLDFMNGKPVPDYDPETEPGHDVLRFSDVTSKNIYTSGLHLEPIKNVVADVSNMDNFRLVGMTLKPFEPQLDAHWEGERIVPQIRFIYQMENPNDPKHVVEQVFFHLKWDVVDRAADEATRKEQQGYFLQRLDALTKARENGGGEQELRDFIREFTTARPVQSISFSSSLTGTWIFGNLERDSTTRELLPHRNVRHGIDYGFYSSVYDTDELRAEIEQSTGERKAELQRALDSLTVDTFRDPKRQDVHALRFNTVTCAQCHQMSGRDGVHMAINDHINSKVTSPTIVTEYYFREADAQMRGDMEKWLASN